MHIHFNYRHVLAALIVITLQGKCLAQDVTRAASQSVAACEAFIAAVNTGNIVRIEEYVRQSIALPPKDTSILNSTVGQLTSLNKEHPDLKIRKLDQSSGAQARVFAQDGNEGWIHLSVGLQEPLPGASQTPKIVNFGYGESLAPIDMLLQQKLSDEQLRQKLDASFDRLIEQHAFSGVIDVRRNGSTIYQLQHGYRDAELCKSIDPSTRFNIASITKMFTAVAVAQLVEQGKIDWNTKVGEVLTDLPNDEIAKQISIHQLLSHTSGVVGAARTVNEHLMPFSARTVADSFGKAVEQPLQFRPGQQFDYSNFGYSLLGRIIERASQQSYHDYVRNHVFKRAGMTQTEFLDLDAAPENYAVGFMDEPGGKRKNNREMLSVIGMPYGGAFSNADDLNHFYDALLRNKLLTEQTCQRMWHPVVEPEPELQYGCGIQMRDYGGHRYYYHGGGWPGVTCHFEFCPELNYSLVLLSNFDMNTHGIAYRLREWLTQGSGALETEVEADPAFTISAELLTKATKVGDSIDVLVSVENNGAIAHSCVVDFEVKNESGEKVEQQFTMQQRFGHNDQKSYRYSWTARDAGNYTLDVGVFGSNWAPKYDFKHSLIQLKIAPK